jgi:hypothetical protein
MKSRAITDADFSAVMAKQGFHRQGAARTMSAANEISGDTMSVRSRD